MASSVATPGGASFLGRLQRRLVQRQQRDAGEQLVGVRQAVVAQAEPPQLNAHQSARDVLVEVAEGSECVGRIRLAEQDAAQHAGVR